VILHGNESNVPMRQRVTSLMRYGKLDARTNVTCYMKIRNCFEPSSSLTKTRFDSSRLDMKRSRGKRAADPGDT